jgi:DNA-binding winged helix-turn-helix (wHTH) protein/TolB-like protein
MERVRFGIFDFNPSTGDLRRNAHLRQGSGGQGVAVRLQAQPARVLAALVSRAGQVVTRETLQREVWSDGTHVDFERGLNFCVAQVRSALGDSAESPRFIETVPREGYRFIAPVSVVPPESGSPAVPDAAFVASLSRRKIVAASIAICVGAILLFTAAALVRARMTDSRPAVVVVPFYNETGRPELDPLAGSLGDAVVTSLAAPSRIGSISVIGNAAALRNPFARQDVQHIARDLDAEWVLIGQLKTDGESLRILAHLIRAADMKHLWAQPFDDERFSLDAQTRTADSIAAAVVSSVATSR